MGSCQGLHTKCRLNDHRVKKIQNLDIQKDLRYSLSRKGSQKSKELLLPSPCCEDGLHGMHMT